MNALLILVILGTTAGSFGGMLTNGIEGMILGGSAGFVLGVLAWISDNIAMERESRELLPEHILHDLNAIARLQHNPTLSTIDES